MQQTPITPSPLTEEKLEALDALVRGPEAWKQYRSTHPGPIDLSGLDIGSAIRERYNMGVEEDVYMPWFDMSNVDLTKATLRRCILDSSNFRDANLTLADLTNSSIVDADFDGATLDGTFMNLAKCYRSRFPYGALRNANLFMRPDSHTTALDEDPSMGEITSLTDLISYLPTWEPHMQMREPRAVRARQFYRGHDVFSWELKPSVMRPDSIGNAESEVLTEFIQKNPDLLSDDETILSQTVRAREYGLPTRLLDITSNPLVATFFAVDDVRHGDEDGALHVFGLPPSMVKSFNSDTVALICAYARLSLRDQRMLTGVYDQTSIDAGYHRLDPKVDQVLGTYNFRWNETMDRLLGEVMKNRHYFSNTLINLPVHIVSFYVDRLPKLF